jgi:hypothetical protein
MMTIWKEIEKQAPVQNSGSLLKNNVPTDYMEAPNQNRNSSLILMTELHFLNIFWWKPK